MMATAHDLGPQHMFSCWNSSCSLTQNVQVVSAPSGPSQPGSQEMRAGRTGQCGHPCDSSHFSLPEAFLWTPPRGHRREGRSPPARRTFQAQWRGAYGELSWPLCLEPSALLMTCVPDGAVKDNSEVGLNEVGRPASREGHACGTAVMKSHGQAPAA